MNLPTFQKDERTFGRLAMLSISFLILTEINTGQGILSSIENLNIESIWWLLGIYA